MGIKKANAIFYKKAKVKDEVKLHQCTVNVMKSRHWLKKFRYICIYQLKTLKRLNIN